MDEAYTKDLKEIRDKPNESFDMDYGLFASLMRDKALEH